MLQTSREREGEGRRKRDQVSLFYLLAKLSEDASYFYSGQK
jgi:hypothetical protein